MGRPFFLWLGFRVDVVPLSRNPIRLSALLCRNALQDRTALGGRLPASDSFYPDGGFLDLDPKLRQIRAPVRMTASSFNVNK
jgi:hypothetical protein